MTKPRKGIIRLKRKAFINFTLFNTRITAFLTYLELPKAVKMTVCPIKNEMGNNLALLYLISFFNFCSIPSNDLNLCRREFGALLAPFLILCSGIYSFA